LPATALLCGVCALHELEHTCCKLLKKFKYANLI
jgi:hypothetical protein